MGIIDLAVTSPLMSGRGVIHWRIFKVYLCIFSNCILTGNISTDERAGVIHWRSACHICYDFSCSLISQHCTQSLAHCDALLPLCTMMMQCKLDCDALLLVCTFDAVQTWQCTRSLSLVQLPLPEVHSAVEL